MRAIVNSVVNSLRKSPHRIIASSPARVKGIKFDSNYNFSSFSKLISDTILETIGEAAIFTWFITKDDHRIDSEGTI